MQLYVAIQLATQLSSSVSVAIVWLCSLSLNKLKLNMELQWMINHVIVVIHNTVIDFTVVPIAYNNSFKHHTHFYCSKYIQM